jgi:hypothetical protein
MALTPDSIISAATVWTWVFLTVFLLVVLTYGILLLKKYSRLRHESRIETRYTKQITQPILSDRKAALWQAAATVCQRLNIFRLKEMISRFLLLEV